MAEHEGIVAVGLLTERDLAMLGESFRRVYRLDESHDFDQLLAAIDQAERDYLAHHGSREDAAEKCRIVDRGPGMAS